MEYPLIGKLKGSDVLTRHADNPLLSREDVPYDCCLVFNAGVAKYQGRYVMVFRNDYGECGVKVTGTNLGVAYSNDGVKWDVTDKPCWTTEDVIRATRDLYGTAIDSSDIQRVYDPRLTVIDGRCYVCLATDTKHGLRGGIAVTDDFEHFEMLSLSAPDNRNMALFPEKIGGNYVRLERPMLFTGAGCGQRPDRFHTWMSESPDMKYWGNSRPVLGAEHVPFANDKVGPAAPPVKTDKGWLTTFHAVDIDPSRGKNGWEDFWRKRYTMGIMLLDLEQPGEVIGMSKTPLMVPEADYETTGGFRNYAIFPCGMLLEDNGEVKIYYGAADTTTCLATADVNDLIALCTDRP
jgi:beta-1,4-mannooligosaccharide/beta-1,4-mannosyl-N-acetylglucosamine phosphorylase